MKGYHLGRIGEVSS